MLRVLAVTRASVPWTLFLLSMLLASAGASGQSDPDSRSESQSAEASYAYLQQTLQSYRQTGRLANNPGIDGAELEVFIDLLDQHHRRFAKDFHVDSAMCTSYRNSEDGEQSDVERARASLALLPTPGELVTHFLASDRDFQNELEYEFGRIVLENINRAKYALSNELALPIEAMDDASLAAFVAVACGAGD